MNSGMISRYSSWHWIHTWLHENWIHVWFHGYEFILMNSYMNSYTWIQSYDFTIFFMIMNSYMNSYYEFMIMNSYATFHDLWIHIWIHVYEEYREIIPEFMCTKVPDVQWVLDFLHSHHKHCPLLRLLAQWHHKKSYLHLLKGLALQFGHRSVLQLLTVAFVKF